MGSQDQCRDAIQRYNAKNLKSPRSESEAAGAVAGAGASQSTPPPPPPEDDGFGAPALDEAGEIDSFCLKLVVTID